MAALRISTASLCSLALGLWGFQTGFLFCAVPMILILEGRHIIRQRWALRLQDLKGLMKLCVITLVFLLTFLLVTQGSLFIVHRLLQWLPISVFSLVAAQTYATNVPTLFRTLMSNPDRLRIRNLGPKKPFSLYPPYFALCLLSASATNWNGLVFYGVAAALIAILLWSRRPKKSHPILWICLILLASGMGFLGHLQLTQLQAKVEQQTAPWLNGIVGETVDPYQAMTQMGNIGSLKQSNAIVFRVVGERKSFPLLLREASYNKYGAGSWVALKSKFARVRPSPDQRTWPLGESVAGASSIKVLGSLNGGKGILRLPDGAAEISQLSVQQMEKNQYGTVKVAGKAGSIAYRIQFDPSQSQDSPPTQTDLEIPETEKPALKLTLEALKLDGQTDAEIVDRLSTFFQQDFQYSLQFAQSQQSATPLAAFLLDHQSGHCEYFASATTLLLRQAGIPARYAVGYSVHEFSPLEKQYIVRSRNAHAWTMAYLNGSWQSVDTTPSNWMAQENTMVSPLQVISDLWSFFLFQLSNGVQHILKGGVWGILGVAIAPFLFFLLWRRVRKLRIRQFKPLQCSSSEGLQTIPQTGIDSEFYLVEQQLIELALTRHASESLPHWMMRLQMRLTKPQMNTLQQILALHYRYRFDPQGLQAQEREQLTTLSQVWLSTFQPQNRV